MFVLVLFTQNLGDILIFGLTNAVTKKQSIVATIPETTPVINDGIKSVILNLLLINYILIAYNTFLPPLIYKVSKMTKSDKIFEVFKKFFNCFE